MSIIKNGVVYAEKSEQQLYLYTQKYQIGAFDTGENVSFTVDIDLPEGATVIDAFVDARGGRPFMVSTNSVSETSINFFCRAEQTMTSGRTVCIFVFYTL